MLNQTKLNTVEVVHTCLLKLHNLYGIFPGRKSAEIHSTFPILNLLLSVQLSGYFLRNAILILFKFAD